MKRAKAMADYMTGMLEQFSTENRDKGGGTNVIGAVIS